MRWSSVANSAGEFVRKQRLWGKLRTVSTQGIDGTWGFLKTFLRSREGVPPQHLESDVKEYPWRRNLPRDADPFFSLACIKSGCFQ